MTLMSRVTGKSISDKEHLIQSLQDIVTTPFGSRIGVRDYGCFLHTLIDKTIDRKWVLDAFFFVEYAIRKWEPRYDLYKVALDGSQISAGRLFMTTSGLYKPTGRVMVLDNITLNFRD